jgi:hypothetical protein
MRFEQIQPRDGCHLIRGFPHVVSKLAKEGRVSREAML